MSQTTNQSGISYSLTTKAWFNGVLVADGISFDTDLPFQSHVSKSANIPNWKWRIANCIDATTTLIGTKKSARFSPGFHAYDRIVPDPFGSRAEGLKFGVLHSPALFADDPAPLNVTKAHNDAIVKFNSRANQVTRSTYGGVFLGELGKTLHSIRHPAQSLRRAVDTYRSEAKKLRRTALGVSTMSELRSLSRAQRRRRTAEASRAIAGSYLEAVYGWLPLKHDIDDGMKALANEFSMNMPHYTVSATGRDKSRSVVETAYLDGFYSWSQIVDRTLEVTYTIRGGMRVQPNNPTRPDARNWGFDLRSFVPTVWELTPYSFLVDYFTNIGDVLEGWSSGSHNLNWSNFTERKSCTCSDTARQNVMPPPANGTLTITFSPHQVVSSWVDVHRAAYTGGFIPSFEWQLPGSSTKWLNIGALILSRSADRFL